eukprot:jgi/Undpi1/4494/HiC_scaffold_17.g07848.m1
MGYGSLRWAIGEGRGAGARVATDGDEVKMAEALDGAGGAGEYCFCRNHEAILTGRQINCGENWKGGHGQGCGVIGDGAGGGGEGSQE